MSRRTPALQKFLDEFAATHQIPQAFRDACEHDYDCTCEDCLGWWASMGPDGDDPDEPGAFGPFTRQQVEEHCRAHGVTVWWKTREEGT